MDPRRRTLTGWLFTVTGFLACPCHLVITLPLAVALLGGTALGGWIATHQGAIALGATLYFVGALALGATLLLAQTSQQVSHHTADTDGADAAAARGAARETTAAPCCPPDPSVGRLAGEAASETTGSGERAAERAEVKGLGSC